MEMLVRVIKPEAYNPYYNRPDLLEPFSIDSSQNPTDHI
jgi:hypothetical protein